MPRMGGTTKAFRKGQEAVKPLLSRPLDLAFTLFFLTHIPTSLLVDGQCALPRDAFPKQVVALLDFHLREFEDPLMGSCPAWFVPIIWCELLLQVPFFCFASYAFIRGKTWIKIPSIMYGTHAATTLVPILGTFWLGGSANQLSMEKKVKLTLIYLPYLIMPLLLVFKMVSRGSEPFAKKRKGD